MQEASMTLIWEGRVDGNLDIVLEATGTVRCRTGITLAFIMDAVAKQYGTVRVSEHCKDHHGKEQWFFPATKERLCGRKSLATSGSRTNV